MDPTKTTAVDLPRDGSRREVESDVSGVGWKEIVLTREEFERLSNRLNNPVIKEVVNEFDVRYGFVLPMVFVALYIFLMFKDELKVPEVFESVLKLLLFIVTVFYITNDNTLKKMSVNFASRLLIGFCFGGLLVASSSVV